MAPEERLPGCLARERECPICGHTLHALKCGDDIAVGVTCPCHCPIPGIY